MSDNVDEFGGFGDNTSPLGNVTLGNAISSSVAFSSTGSSQGSVVARGTGEGLILRLDGRISRTALLASMIEYVESRKSFFSGQEVTLEWLEARPQDGVLSEICATLLNKYQMVVKTSRMFERLGKGQTVSHNNINQSEGFLSEPVTGTADAGWINQAQSSTPNQQNLRPVAISANFDPTQLSARKNSPITSDNNFDRTSSGFTSGFADNTGFAEQSTSLFDGVTALGQNNIATSAGISGFSVIQGSGAGLTGSGLAGNSQGKINMQGFNGQESKGAISEALLWDEPDARIIRETLRGGQKIESEHSVVIVGDVNSGAEIVAGGDIFVLGRLRGVAHAGAYDESGAGRKILALQMQPTQLRIGSIISQGSAENGKVPEIAKIEGNMIVVEPYGFGNVAQQNSTKKVGR